MKIIKMKYKFHPQWISFAHAHKDTSPVLKEEASWRTINGVVIGHKMILFRRYRDGW